MNRTSSEKPVDASTGRELVLKSAAYLKDASYVKNTVQQIEAERKSRNQVAGYQELYKKIQRMLFLQNELKWLNMEAVRLAYDDMEAVTGF